MDAVEFREQGKKMIDFVAKYLDTIGERRVTPDVEPGYLKSLIPLEAPEIGEKFDDIMADIEPKIMNGMVRGLLWSKQAMDVMILFFRFIGNIPGFMHTFHPERRMFYTKIDEHMRIIFISFKFIALIYVAIHLSWLTSWVMFLAWLDFLG